MNLIALITALVITNATAYSQGEDGILMLNTEKINKTVVLTWTPSTQPETNHFEIQRSRDGKNWTAIAIMFPFEDNSTTHAYKFSDKSHQRAGTYYRIRQIDTSRKETFSEVKRIGAKGK